MSDNQQGNAEEIAQGPQSTPLSQLSAEEIARLSDFEFEQLNIQRRRDRQGFRW